MLQSYLNKRNKVLVGTRSEKPTVRVRRWYLGLGLPVWVFLGFYAAALAAQELFVFLHWIGSPIAYVHSSVLSAVAAAVVYLFSVGIIIGIPWLLWRYRTSLEDIGLQRLVSWSDIGLAPAGFVIYLLASGGIVYLVEQAFPSFNVAQAQAVGFNDVTRVYEYFLAFMTLVLVAPLAEEILFRGYLYGKLKQSIPTWAAMIVTSALFGFIHGQWNVGIDVFALSLVACSLREVTGSIWAGILLHMMKNGLAFYILFINTSFLIK